MMKWLREHTKQIMVVVVLLAMFSFVGGPALVEILAPSEDLDPVARAFGEVITLRDLRPSQRDTEVLERLVGTPMVWKYDQPDRRLQPDQWHLLAMEAERAGIAVSDAEVDDYLKELGEQQGFSGRFEMMRTVYGITPPEIRKAVRRHMAIMKRAEYLGNCSMPSESQVRHHVRDTGNRVSVELVSISAEKFIDNSALLTAPELEAQFTKYKDAVRGEDPSGYGYKLPRRVKLQYVVADINRLSPHVKVSFEEVKTHWKANKANYKKTIYEVPASQPGTSQPASSQPVPTSVEKSLSEAQMDVERDLRRRSAQRAATGAMDKITDLLQKPWLTEKSDEKTGFKSIPAEVRDPNFMRVICDKAAAEFGIPLECKETPLQTQEEIGKDPDLRNAKVAGDEADALKLADYAFRVPPFFERKSDADTALCLQLFQSPTSPLTASNLDIMGLRGFTLPKDRLVIFRVVEAEEARAPKTLDEVRAQVEHDVRLARAMIAAEPIAQELFIAAERIGLAAAFDLFSDLQEKIGEKAVSTPPPFARLQRYSGEKLQKTLLAGEPTVGPPEISGVGRSEKFVDACFAMTADGWKPPRITPPASVRVQQATTRPAQTPAPKINLVELPAQGKWSVVQLKKFEPVDQTKYEQEQRDQAYSSLVGERGAFLLVQWFKPEVVEQRCGYERIKQTEAPQPREGMAAEPEPSHPLLEYGQN